MMDKLILLASAAAMAVSMPALAKPGKGGGQGGGKSHAAHGNAAKVDVRNHGRARTDWRTGRTGARVDRIRDINRNGVSDHRERWIDRDRNGIDDRAHNRYGGAACPPGLAKKTPACVPPGQAKRGFQEGSKLPVQYGYVPVPSQYRDNQAYLDALNRYDPDRYRYYYSDGNIDQVYVVDPRTRVIQDIINLAL